MSLRLIIEDDEGTTTIVPLGEDAITIGRQQGNTIQLTEKNVSRRHARLYPESAAWVIEDLGSYNGVKVNAQSVEGRVALKEGDVIQIGDYHLALTEDVDKRALNYDPPRDAANDNEPMLASSSADLPQLSPEELAALQSGPHTPPPGSPVMMDSGPMPAVAPYPGAYSDERRGGSAGVLIAGGVVVAGGLAVALFWLAQGGGASETGTIASSTADVTPATKSAPKEVGTKALPAKVAPVPPTPAPPPEANGGSVEPPVVPTEPVEPPPEEPPPEQPPVAENPPAQGKSGGRSKSGRKKTNPKKPPPKDTPPPPPKPKPKPEPSVDADALFAQAQKLQFSQPARAYSLAKKAYDANKRGQLVVITLVNSACGMKDAGKAKRWIAKLRGAKKEQMTKVCKNKGVEV